MPEIGDIAKGNEIGLKVKCGYVWHACQTCNKEYWVRLHHGEPRNLICHSCSGREQLRKLIKWGPDHPSWKGGRQRFPNGYFATVIYPDDFFYPMAMKSGRVLEHRLVMAKHLKRCLLPWEIVHHKGTKYPIDSKENRGDNRIENLDLLGCNGKHNKLVEKVLKRQAKLIKELQARIRQLEGKIGTN